MIRRSVAKGLAVLSLTSVLGACGSMNDLAAQYEVRKQAIQSFEITTTKLKGDAAFGALTSVFVERGFDIKISNKEGGLVTTEYKKFASVGGSPPFDYYLQIRATVRDIGGGNLVIRLSPLLKEQNRANAAAFTEHELYYLEGSPEAVRNADKGGWVNSGQVLFMNVVTDLSARAGVPLDAVKRNVTTTKFNSLLM